MKALALADLVDDCGQDWGAMTPCDSDSKHCSACSRTVVDVSDLSAMISAWMQGLCVAVDDTIQLDRDDLRDKWPVHRVGVVYSKSKPVVRGVAYNNRLSESIGGVVND